jgi:hypothetical protein
VTWVAGSGRVILLLFPDPEQEPDTDPEEMMLSEKLISLI